MPQPLSPSRKRALRSAVNNPLPLPDVPPFWEAIPEAEVFRYGAPTTFDETARAAGWVLARFLITNDAAEQTRQTMVGYVRRGFAVYLTSVDREKLAILIHLKTGYCLSRTLLDDDILYVADVLDPALPWETCGIEEINAGAQAYLARLEGAGLRCVRVYVFGQSTLVWTRARAPNRPASGLPSQIEGEGR